MNIWPSNSEVRIGELELELSKAEALLTAYRELLVRFEERVKAFGLEGPDVEVMRMLKDWGE